MNEDWLKDYPMSEGLKEEALDENSSLKKILYLIGEGKQVADFGCATGYLANLLQKKGCIVTGIEINPDAAKVAEKYCQKVIVADLDFVSITEILPAHKFDVAIFGDVLEHLRNPWKVLEQTKDILKEHGFVVASIPNIAHGAIRLALLQGKFEYMKLGILDDTHLRFFTCETAKELFEKSGYLIDELDKTKLPLFYDSDLVPRLDANNFSKEIIHHLQQDKDIDTLQFIIRAFPISEESKYTILNSKYEKVLVERDLAQTQLQQIQSELEWSQSQLQETQAELAQSQSQLQETQTELAQSQSQLQETQTELAQSQSQLQETQTELAQSRSQLQQTQTELAQSHKLMIAMMSSKFWQLRTLWLKLKQIFVSDVNDAATDWLIQYISKSNRVAEESHRAAQEIEFSKSDKSAQEIKLYVNYVFSIPKTGIYLQGWLVDPMSKVKNLKLVSTDGNEIDLDQYLQRKKRADIFTQFQQKLYQLPSDELGIYGCVPMEVDLTKSSQWVIEANLKSGETLKFNIESMELPEQPLQIIQNILNIDPLPRHKLRSIFNKHVGPTIRHLWQNRNREITKNICEYGEQPPKPEASIIVPLYGRIDFLKYQLAIFADDPDFKNNELIYVLDDPRMYDEFINLCELLAPLFRVPFKTLYMGTNLGYAGANNAGVSVSQSRVVVLMNSDVMPAQSGWISKLISIYDSLEQVGAIGPKLLYEDGSIQHAGMEFCPYSQWDNLLINDHPKKGQANIVQPNPQPKEVPAVTGACLMVSRHLYEKVNGLDEEYIIGNFEDSDLCLKLHKNGYRNYYIPGVELFHFESQSIKSNCEQPSWYQNQTLYNCWLHNLKWENYILNNQFLRSSIIN